MKIRVLLLTGILFFLGNLSAQDQAPRLSQDDIIAKKWEFILQKTNLSAEDAMKVEPLFKATELETWSLVTKNRAIMKKSRNKNLTGNVDYEALNEALINFQVESAQNQKNYYLKLKAVVAPDVINRLLGAEKSYKRELMKNVPGRKKNISPPPTQ